MNVTATWCAGQMGLRGLLQTRRRKPSIYMECIKLLRSLEQSCTFEARWKLSGFLYRFIR